MKINTTARHFDLTPELKEHGEEKLRRLERYFDQIHQGSITITRDKFRYRAEVTLEAGGGGDFVASEETADIVTAIDGAVAAIEQQIRRHKGRLIDRREKRQKIGTAMAAEEDAIREAEEQAQREAEGFDGG